MFIRLDLLLLHGLTYLLLAVCGFVSQSYTPDTAVLVPDDYFLYHRLDRMYYVN